VPEEISQLKNKEEKQDIKQDNKTIDVIDQKID